MTREHRHAFSVHFFTECKQKIIMCNDVQIYNDLTKFNDLLEGICFAFHLKILCSLVNCNLSVDEANVKTTLRWRYRYCILYVK